MNYEITFVDRDTVIFFGYTIKRCGCLYQKNGKKQLRATKTMRRKGIGCDADVGLMINKKRKWFKVQRLIGLCFHSKTGDDIDDMQANHIDRNTLNNHADNIEWLTPSENQRHWREDESLKQTEKIIAELEK